MSTLSVGCSSGGGGGGGEAALTIAVTDAASDELASFTVDITAIQLTRPGGGAVGVLPSPATVDLVTLEEVSQILNVVNVPPGLYTAADVTFDFTNASAYLIGETNPATILDGDGNPLTGSVTLPISIGNVLRAIAGRNRILELDFDLNHSVTVDTPGNTVFVEPMIVMRVDRTDPKELFLGGVTQSVDTAMNEIAMELQTLAGVRLADVEAAVDALTVYQIDGMPMVGAAGLAALEAMPVGTWLQVYGAVDPQRAMIDAAYIEAGTGTYNGGSDIVEGHIVARTGGAGADPILTVLGHSNNASHTTFQLNANFTVSASFANSQVVYRGGVQTLDTDDLNVGQRVRIFGTLSGFTLDATNATDVIRVQQSRLLGFANAASVGGVLDIDLVRVGLRDENLFTWTDGGPTPPDPDNMLTLVGGLDAGLGITAGTAVEIRGVFPAVDDAAEDFVATSVVNRDLAPSLLVVHDRLGGQTVVTTVDLITPEISFGITGAPVPGELAVVDRGFVGATPLPAAPAPTVSSSTGLGFFVLHDRVTGATTVHIAFASFAAELDMALALGAQVYNFGAVGAYDVPGNAMDAFLVAVGLN